MVAHGVSRGFASSGDTSPGRGDRNPILPFVPFVRFVVQPTTTVLNHERHQRHETLSLTRFAALPLSRTDSSRPLRSRRKDTKTRSLLMSLNLKAGCPHPAGMAMRRVGSRGLQLAAFPPLRLRASARKLHLPQTDSGYQSLQKSAFQ
jgi:hypothetical protein